MRAVATSRAGTERTRAEGPRRTNPASSSVPLLGLQSAAGNAAVSSLLQRKEQESDAGVATTKRESADLYDKASAAFDAGRYQEARRLFESLLSGRYRHREALTTLVWNLAMCKAHLGDYDGAFELGITYGHYGGGRADEQRLLEQIERVRQADTAGAADAGVRTPQTKDAAGELYEKATAAFQGGEYVQATALFETLLASPVRHDEALPTIVWNLAMCKAHLGDFDRAYDLALQYGRFPAGGDERRLLEQIEALRQGLVGEEPGAATPKTRDEAAALFEKASASLAAKQYDEAKRMFERLLPSPVKHSEALPAIVWSLAMCRAHLGDFDGARRLALTYTQYRGTADDERTLFVQIEQLQRASEGGAVEPGAAAP